MVPGKVVITGLIVVAVFAGCLKKKTDSDNGSASGIPPATTPSVATQSQDIFDEFYKADSAPSPKSESKASRKKPVSRSLSGVSPSFVEGGNYVVQVATHPSRRLAEATSNKLSAKGYPSYIVEVQNPTPALTGTYYRVRIGGFSGTAAARAFGEQSLTPDGYEFWVDNRSNDNIGLSGSGLGSGSTSPYGSEPQPATDYQSAPAPAPEPVAATPAPQPAASAAPAPAPATTPAPAPATSGSATKSEWGNDGW